MQRHKLTQRIIIAVLFFALAICGITIRLSSRARERFPVRGVDVSSYQGYIDWDEIEESDIDFAFIKATEGSTFRDKMFRDNIENIADTGIAAGAYHFMSFESSGEAQAENFISVVEADKLTLPPVIDLEIYGKYNDKPPGAAYVRGILDVMVERLHEEYGVYPIIYTNRRAYSLYVSGEYRDCDIWLCDLVKEPALPDGREWMFWQYSHTEILPGYDGEEEHIDMNIFNGSRSEFRRYIKRK